MEALRRKLLDRIIWGEKWVFYLVKPQTAKIQNVLALVTVVGGLFRIQSNIYNEALTGF